MILIKNAEVFDGTTDEIKKNRSVIIDGEYIKEITTDQISEENFDRIIDATGKTVIPGLVDSHVHLMFGDGRLDELTVKGVRNAKNLLEAGFTTIRDAGGAVYGIKHGIDAGIIPGPRIFPSYAFISQTCGHGDFRETRAAGRLLGNIYASPNLLNGQSVLADGVDEVLKAVREQLFLGASQIKIMAGGGMSSKYDPVQTQQYTFEEMKAAVDAASDYGTYVLAHLYTNESIKRALRAGIKSLEHAHMLDDESAKIASDQGAFIVSCPNFGKTKKSGKESPTKDYFKNQARENLIKAYDTQTEFINKYDLNIAYGTDFIDLFTQGVVKLDDLVTYGKRFGNYKALKSATGNAYELSKLTTYQNPYPEGKIGVLESGAFADLIVVQGNPLEDISVLADANNIRIVIKNGEIYKEL